MKCALIGETRGIVYCRYIRRAWGCGELPKTVLFVVFIDCSCSDQITESERWHRHLSRDSSGPSFRQSTNDPSLHPILSLGSPRSIPFHISLFPPLLQERPLLSPSPPARSISYSLFVPLFAIDLHPIFLSLVFCLFYIFPSR